MSAIKKKRMNVFPSCKEYQDGLNAYAAFMSSLNIDDKGIENAEKATDEILNRKLSPAQKRLLNDFSFDAYWAYTNEESETLDSALDMIVFTFAEQLVRFSRH